MSIPYEAIVGTISSILTLAQAYKMHQQSTKQANDSLIQGHDSLIKAQQSLRQGQVDAEATILLEGRDRFTKKITGEFEEISLQTNVIREIDSHLTKLEQRITTILSDYTALLNQVSIVSTLMLGVATATFGSLLGNTEDQPKWKVNMYVISCVITICLSVYSVIESFFLSIHIYAEESKFIAGQYPHRDTGTRSFNLDTLVGLSSSYSRVIVTFFVSFLSFSLTILSMMYIGLGLSLYILGQDVRKIKSQTNTFLDVKDISLSEVEPEFQGIAFSMTCIVVVTYVIIIWLFITSYRKNVMCPKWCGADCYRESLKQPMRFTASEFERIQIELNHQFDDWSVLYKNFLRYYEKCIIKEDCEGSWGYGDIEYEKFIYRSFKRQLQAQRIILKQIRLLQITDLELRSHLSNDSFNSEVESKTLESKTMESKTFLENHAKIIF